MKQNELEGYLALEWVQTCEERLKKQGVYAVKAWIEYWEDVENELPPQTAVIVLKRALVYLPRSYKLWKILWEFLIRKEQEPSLIVSCFERALLTLSPFPRVWIAYLQYLSTITVHPTVVRRTLSAAFSSVAITQHGKLWSVARELFLEESVLQQLPVASLHTLWQRYCTFAPTVRAEYAAFCERHQQWGDAAQLYYTLVQEEGNGSEETIDGYWQAFGDLVAQHPQEVSDRGLNWEHILGEHIASKDAALWLAAAWIRLGDVDQARSVYEKSLQTVQTVRDFTVIYAAYLQLEEGLLEQLGESFQEGEEEEDTNEEPTVQVGDALFAQSSKSRLATMELALARAEHLTARRGVLLNAVKLRQNPDNIDAWLERAELLPARAGAAALETALQTVHRPSSRLVTKLIELYDPSQVRELMDRVCRKSGKRWDKRELSECWVSWIEFELGQEAWDDALSLARQSVAKLPRSVRVWDLRLDLEESLGGLQTTKDAYQGALETKVATVNHVLQFANFLKENKYYEESFAAYEIGVELFAFPHAGAKVLWKSYLTDFLERFSGTKVERARHLFQRCLSDCPAEECVEFYLLNGEFEEKYGLAQRALSVYRDMSERVTKEQKYTAYQLYVTKTAHHLGSAATRQIYEEALEKLKDEAQTAVRLCQDFAKTEVKMEQVERARAIYAYGAQSADPRVMPEFWKDWNDFEIVHGNEDTFREMLRIKRSTETAFSAVNFNAMGMTEQVQNFTDEEAMRMIASGEGVDLEDTMQSEKPQTAVAGFVTSKKRGPATIDDVEERMHKLRKAAGATDDAKAIGLDENEIDLDDEDE